MLRAVLYLLYIFHARAETLALSRTIYFTRHSDKRRTECLIKNAPARRSNIFSRNYNARTQKEIDHSAAVVVFSQQPA
jgi:hypothetical protein